MKTLHELAAGRKNMIDLMKYIQKMDEESMN